MERQRSPQYCPQPYLMEAPQVCLTGVPQLYLMEVVVARSKALAEAGGLARPARALGEALRDRRHVPRRQAEKPPSADSAWGCQRSPA